MTSTEQKTQSLRHKGTFGLGKTARIAASLGLAFTLLGPLGQSAPTAEADLLKWDYMMAPGMDTRDTSGIRTPLPTFGTSAVLAAGGAGLPMTHPVVVAPNGDLFTAGKVATGGVGRVYKSSDGGLTWQANNNIEAGNPFPASSRIVGIAVAPKYPQDNRVYAAFSDDIPSDDTNDGVAVSTNGGNTFVTIVTGGAAGAALGDMDLALGGGTQSVSSIAVSQDFDGSTSAGQVMVGLSNTADGRAIRAMRLDGAAVFSGASVPTANMTPVASGALNFGSAANVISLAYSPGEVTRLSALVGITHGLGGTHVVDRASGTTFGTPAENDSTELSDMVAVVGKVAYADTYTSGGTYYAGWTDSVTAAPAAAAGVYKFDGTVWSQQTGTGAPIGIAITDIAVSGTGGTATILAAEGGTANTRLYKSTNAASSFTNRNYGGQDPVTAITPGSGAVANVAVAKDFATNAKAYVATNAVGGGVLMSANGGTNWTGTGLTNAAAVLTSLTVGSGDTAFAIVGAAGLFKTTNLSSSNAGWKQVERTAVGTVVVPAGFATHGTVYLRRAIAGDTPILKSTDGGESFNTSGLTSPDANTIITTLSCSSATQCWAGMADGKIFITTNGASSWDAGRDIGDNVRGFLRSPGFATDNTIFAEVDSSGSTSIMMSTDGGATWTMVGSGSGAWGSGVGTGSLVISPNFATDKAMFYRPNSPTNANELWRIKVGTDTQWVKMGSGTSEWSTIRVTAAPGVGDGLLFQALNRTNGNIVYTWYPLTVTESTWSKVSHVTANTHATLPAGFFTAASTATVSYDAVANGTRIRSVSVGVGAGQLASWTDTPAFLAGLKTIQPGAGTNVVSNVGQNGIPVTFTWQAVDRAQCYDIQIALDMNFDIPILDTTAFALTCPTGVGTTVPSSAAAVVTASGGTFNAALSQGNTYYWRVRVRGVGPSLGGADLSYAAGAWSNTASFAVGSHGAPTAPAPQLPADGTTMPNLGPIQLSWNNPSGTTQFHVQVLPLNNDGQAIDLIIGDPAQVAAATYTVQPPVMGQGNYVILPGAAYNWRVRTTTKSGEVSVVDPSWGPWSDVRTFKTPRPTAASIQVQQVTPSATPTVSWKNSNVNNFYYEVQISQDRTFNADPATATAAVYWNLIHGGLTNPLNSYTLPAGTTLEKGKTYYARVRQRVQATALGADEPGIGWSQMVSFIVP